MVIAFGYRFLILIIGALVVSEASRLLDGQAYYDKMSHAVNPYGMVKLAEGLLGRNEDVLKFTNESLRPTFQ